MQLSPLATRLLQVHASKPQQIFYGTEALGSIFRSAELARLDQAYEELVRADLMEPAGALISYFGAPKSLHRITAAGLSTAAQESAA